MIKNLYARILTRSRKKVVHVYRPINFMIVAGKGRDSLSIRLYGLAAESKLREALPYIHHNPYNTRTYVIYILPIFVSFHPFCFSFANCRVNRYL